MDTIVAGAVAAFTVDCLVYPLDTLKTRLQAYDYHARFPAGRGLYSGLYQGLGAVIAVTIPAAGAFFTTYEHTKRLYASERVPLLSAHPGLVHLFASCTSELVSCAVLCPAEVIKQRAQVKNPYTVPDPVLAASPTAAAAATAAAHARRDFRAVARGLGRSYVALVGRNLPFVAIQFPIYEDMRARLGRRLAIGARTDGKSEFIKVGLVAGGSAATAGAIAAVITTPIDVAKTRIMLASEEAAAEAATSQGVFATIKDIVKTEGPRALTKGMALRSVWTALGAGLYLGSYEAGKMWWRDRQSVK